MTTEPQQQIQQQVSLKPFNTFGVAATARYYAEVNSAPQLQLLLQQNPSSECLILGGGSNILFIDDINALVLHNRIRGITCIADNDDEILLQVGAGENWHELVMFTVAHNYWGIENLALIPGTVGAAPIQNIGAYGAEFQQVFVELTAFDRQTNTFVTLQRDECHFAYRNSLFKRAKKLRYIITSVTIKLSKHAQANLEYKGLRERINENNPSPSMISQAVIAIRQQKLPDPAKLGNAGSFFKNPCISDIQYAKIKQQHKDIPHFMQPDHSIKIPAAWLIEQCGFKQFRENNVGSYQHQALVLVNYGNASGQHILNVAQTIQAKVKQTFDIELEPEVRIIPEETLL